MTARILAAITAFLLPATPLAARQAAPATAADTGAFQVFTGEGKAASLEQLLAASEGVDVLFLGESHNDIVGHRLQRRIFDGLLGGTRNAGESMSALPGGGPAGVRPIALSLEMFDRDVQSILDEYLA